MMVTATLALRLLEAISDKWRFIFLEPFDCLLKVEFAYLKLLPREYSGPPHVVSVSQRPDGRCEYEERPGPPPNHAEDQDPNVMRVYFVRAQEAGSFP
jgi:hypothetical protein